MQIVFHANSICIYISRSKRADQKKKMKTKRSLHPKSPRSSNLIGLSLQCPSHRPRILSFPTQLLPFLMQYLFTRSAVKFLINNYILFILCIIIRLLSPREFNPSYPLPSPDEELVAGEVSICW